MKNKFSLESVQEIEDGRVTLAEKSFFYKQKITTSQHNFSPKNSSNFLRILKIAIFKATPTVCF